MTEPNPDNKPGWRCPECNQHYFLHGIDRLSGKPVCPPKATDSEKIEHDD